MSPSSLAFVRLPLFLIAAAAIGAVPYLGAPLEWFETFFHELSHGVAGLATGGTSSRFELNIDGSGALWTAGGSDLLIGFAGYAGVFAWGALLWCLADTAGTRLSQLTLWGLTGLVVVVLLAWASILDPVTWGIGLVVAGLPAAAARWLPKVAGPMLRLLGAAVFVSGLKSPLVLLQVDGASDATRLRDATFLPVTLWVGLWLLTGLTALWFLWRWDRRRVAANAPPLSAVATAASVA